MSASSASPSSGHNSSAFDVPTLGRMLSGAMLAVVACHNLEQVAAGALLVADF